MNKSIALKKDGGKKGLREMKIIVHEDGLEECCCSGHACAVYLNLGHEHTVGIYVAGKYELHISKAELHNPLYYKIKDSSYWDMECVEVEVEWTFCEKSPKKWCNCKRL